MPGRLLTAHLSYFVFAFLLLSSLFSVVLRCKFTYKLSLTLSLPAADLSDWSKATLLGTPVPCRLCLKVDAE